MGCGRCLHNAMTEDCDAEITEAELRDAKATMVTVLAKRRRRRAQRSLSALA